MCWHKWDRWEIIDDQFFDDLTYASRGRFSGKYRVITQKKECLKCKMSKFKVNKIKIIGL